MKFSLLLQNAIFSLLILSAQAVVSQTVIKGKVINATTGEGLYLTNVVIKGTTEGVQSDFDGSFILQTDQKLPLTLNVSFIGFESSEMEVTEANKKLVVVKLSDKTTAIDVVEVKGQRISEKQKSSPLTIEQIDQLAIKNASALSFYEETGKLKGVDITTASLGFTIINMRGFNSTSPVRSLQIIDGVDNQAPGLNFSLGNFLGSSELDVLKLELVAGASSAYYGPNAFNGVISIETKNPFYQKGLSASLKYGERNFTEMAIRYADALKNKKGQDWLAYKFNFAYLKADDWVANNTDSVYQSQNGKRNPGGYDKVNTYGDEDGSSGDFSKAGLANYGGLGQFHRTGYQEKDLVDYNTKNIKANAAIHIRTNPSQQESSPELILSSNFGTGTTVYQGDVRFSLKNVLFFQNRIEFRKRDKFFLRFYTTDENAGDSYNPYFTAYLLQNRSKTNTAWQTDYSQYWIGTIQPKMIALEYPQVVVITDPKTGFPCINYACDPTVSAAAEKWLATHYDSLLVWHQQARNAADFTGKARLVPGTQAFADAFNQIISRPNNAGVGDNAGTKFVDHSALYHGHGEYRFTPDWTDEWVVGANARLYTPSSDGTVFADGRQPFGPEKINSVTGLAYKDSVTTTITNFEYGVYTGIEKKFSNKRFKLNATVRMDKNQNFDYVLSPAASLVWQPDAINFLRLSFSSAVRNPTLNDQYLNLNVGPAVLAGNINGVDSLITTQSLTEYVQGGSNAKLVYFHIDPIRPEKVKSVEMGYRTTLFDKIFLDASYYYSFYNDFIGYKIGVKTQFDPQTHFPIPAQTTVYRYAANSDNQVTTQGFSVGLNYYFARYYQLSGNYSYNQLNTKVDDPIIPAFNTPLNKYNLGLSGRDVVFNIGGTRVQNFGFSLNYKWVQGFVSQGSPQFTGYIPNYSIVDAQLNYHFVKLNTIAKISVSNLLDNQQEQTYGGPRIGRLAFIGLLYEFTKKN